ncbi:PAS domain S-box protein [Maribellus comscasis]|uniref:histidine kinase n=1 Tax=Maribellus comscasis TaxID=2681766 RepID=A0A6I6K5W3_9BACT|nr:PAS domain-containing sensor histidine kinase [Maribellus comscasis]QGY45404.1 PAS domain S-box protein [Maribellus comscasis]
MSKRFSHIISEKFWSHVSEEEKQRLFSLFIIIILALIVTVANFVYKLFFYSGNSCFVCNAGLVAIVTLAGVFCLRGKINSVLYTAFTIPIFLYAYYISDFNDHPPLIETAYYSLWWLLGGLLVLIYFAESESLITTYSIISLFTLGFQLLKANHLFDPFSFYEPYVTHPLLVFVAFYGITIGLRLKLKRLAHRFTEKLTVINQGISKVFQDSGFSIVQIKAERDEDDNITNLWIEKVNNAFESSFKLNLYEVQNQEAGYVFNLIFRNHFDVNKTLLLNKKKTKEFYAKNLERHFKAHILKPEYNRFYIIFEDITRIKLKVAELEENKRRYKVLLEAIPDIFFVIDKEGTYEDFVIKESDLFKIEDANIIGNTIYDVGFPDNMADKIYACIQTSLKANSIETIEYSLNTHNGTFMFEMRLAKLTSHSVISIARDITRRKTTEFKLERALNKAEESDRLKSAFLANLSHEIRTPLNIITNFTRMMAEPDIDQLERMEFSDAISQNGQQLLNMIDNTIHLSRIETEAVEVHVDFCKINNLLRDIYNKYRPLIPDTKDIRINMNLDVPNPAFGFETDAKLLREILSILVDNAIKYSVKGDVSLGYEMILNEAVQIYVSDNGIGIPEDETENIFSRFYRIKNNINETTSGSGLGLPIAQHYVSLLGSELELKSVPGQGTKFWFTLPFREGKGFLKIVS